MPLDIQAIQYLYGAPTPPGNETVTLADDGTVRTIWDPGHQVTVDASHLGEGITFDASPGKANLIGATGALSIANDSTVTTIIGTSFADTLIGGSNGGTFTGGGGNDTITGSNLGANTAVYAGP